MTCWHTTTPARIGSLCSGYEGLAMGLQAVIGGQVVWQADNDPHATRILAERFPDVPNLGDITTVDWTRVAPVDWVCAGYPCQPFSHAGLRKGTADERHLWPHVAAAIRALRPQHVLLENVAGHVTLGFDVVLADLAALGFDAWWGVVRASDAGAPHGRARLFVVASDTSGERHGSRQDGRGLGCLDGADEGEARQRERSRAVAGDRSATTPADPGGGSLAGAGATGNGLSVTAEHRALTPADPNIAGSQRPQSAERYDLSARSAPPDAERSGRHGWPLEPQRDAQVGTAAAGSRENAPADPHDSTHDRQWPRAQSRSRIEKVAWGVYEPAVRRWEHALGWPAPSPTEPGRSGRRLSPRFVEWMMGLPDGWVTGIDIPRNAQLRVLGNGCVPQQVALAVRTLLPMAVAA